MPPTERSHIGDWLNRKTAYSRRIKAKLRCWCGKPTYGYSLCGKHLQMQRERMRQRRTA